MVLDTIDLAVKMWAADQVNVPIQSISNVNFNVEIDYDYDGASGTPTAEIRYQVGLDKRKGDWDSGWRYKDINLDGMSVADFIKEVLEYGDAGSEDPTSAEA